MVYAPNRKEYFFFLPAKLKYVGCFFLITPLVDIATYYQSPDGIHQCFMNLLGIMYGIAYGLCVKHAKYRQQSEKSTSQGKSLINIDEIWEKMSRTGYESLTPEEKELLFKQKDRS